MKTKNTPLIDQFKGLKFEDQLSFLNAAKSVARQTFEARLTGTDAPVAADKKAKPAAKPKTAPKPKKDKNAPKAPRKTKADGIQQRILACLAAAPESGFDADQIAAAVLAGGYVSKSVDFVNQTRGIVSKLFNKGNGPVRQVKRGWYALAATTPATAPETPPADTPASE